MEIFLPPKIKPEQRAGADAERSWIPIWEKNLKKNEYM